MSDDVKTPAEESGSDSFEEKNPTEGLPPDLAALLRDPSIIVPQDAAVFELIAKAMDAPSDTASAMSVDEWRQAWSVTCRRMLAAQQEADRLRSALREIDRYSCYGAPWDAYVAVKRIAREVINGD